MLIDLFHACYSSEHSMLSSLLTAAVTFNGANPTGDFLLRLIFAETP
jgi:hypothetical protein